MSDELPYEFRRRGPTWGLVVTLTLLVLAVLISAGALVAVGIKVYADAKKPLAKEADQVKQALADLPGDLQGQLGPQIKQLQDFLGALQAQQPGGQGFNPPRPNGLGQGLNPPRPNGQQRLGQLGNGLRFKPGEPFGLRRFGIAPENAQVNREGKFKLSDADNGVTLTVEGFAVNGHPTVERVVVDNGVAVQEYANLEAVPEPFRTKARALVERSLKGLGEKR